MADSNRGRPDFKIFRDEPWHGAFGQYYYTSDFGELYSGTGIGTIGGDDDIFTLVEYHPYNHDFILDTNVIAQCTEPDASGNLYLMEHCINEDVVVLTMPYETIGEEEVAMIDQVPWYNFNPNRNIDWAKFSLDFWSGYWTYVRPKNQQIGSGYNCHHDGWDDWDCQCRCDNGKGGDNIAECDDNNNGECWNSCYSYCDDWTTWSLNTVDDFRPIAYAFTGEEPDTGFTVQKYYDTESEDYLATSAPNVVKLQLLVSSNVTTCATLYKSSAECCPGGYDDGFDPPQCTNETGCVWVDFEQSADVVAGTGIIEGICSGQIAADEIVNVMPLESQECTTLGCSEYEIMFAPDTPAETVEAACSDHTWTADGVEGHCEVIGSWGAEYHCLVPTDILNSGINPIAFDEQAHQQGLGTCTGTLACSFYSEYYSSCLGQTDVGCIINGTWNSGCWGEAELMGSNPVQVDDIYNNCPTDADYNDPYPEEWVMCGDQEAEECINASGCTCGPVAPGEDFDGSPIGPPLIFTGCSGTVQDFCSDLFANDESCPSGVILDCDYTAPYLHSIYVETYPECINVCKEGGDYCYKPYAAPGGDICEFEGSPVLITNPSCVGTECAQYNSDYEECISNCAICAGTDDGNNNDCEDLNWEECGNTNLEGNGSGDCYRVGHYNPGTGGHCRHTSNASSGTDDSCMQNYSTQDDCIEDNGNWGGIKCCMHCEDPDNDGYCGDNGWGSDLEVCLDNNECYNDIEEDNQVQLDQCVWENPEYKECSDFTGNPAACGYVLGTDEVDTDPIAGTQCDNCQYLDPGIYEYTCERERFQCVNTDSTDTSDRLIVPDCQKFIGFVANWDWREGDESEFDKIVDDFPNTSAEWYAQVEENDLFDYTDLADMESGKKLLEHQYDNYGVKVIKAIVFSYVENPYSHEVQAMRWKLLTIRLVLGIDDVYVEDFGILGGADFNFIPWPKLSPVIGGISQESKYRKSVEKIYNSNLFTSTEVIDKDLAYKAYLNDELGRYPGKLDIAQVRMFNSGTFDLPKLLHIEDWYSNIINLNSQFDWEPYGEYYPGDFNYNIDEDWAYWDGVSNKFPMETSIGSLFIDEAIQVVREACLFEYNLGEISLNTVRDSSGNNNTGIVIGDYGISKTSKTMPLRREQTMKLPETDSEDGAI